MADSDKRIIYTDDNGQVCVVIPADNCGLTLEQIKGKDVPSGKTATIVDKSAVPSDRTFRDSWTFTP